MKPLSDKLYATYLRVTPESRLTESEQRARERMLQWDADHPEQYREHRKLVGRTVFLTQDRTTIEGRPICKGARFRIVETSNGKLIGESDDGSFLSLSPTWVEVDDGGVITKHESERV